MFWIGLLGFFVCLVMLIISFFKKDGRVKKYSLLLLGSVVLVIVSTFGIEPNQNEPVAAEPENHKSELDIKKANNESSQSKPQLSKAQLEVINNFQGQDFEEFTKAYYSLTLDEQTGVENGIYLDYLHEKEVTWSGTVIKDGVWSSQVLVYGYSEGYNGETWEQIENTHKASLMFFADVDNDETIKLIKPGDKVTFQGIIGINGEQKKDNGEGINKRWKLYNAQVISINGTSVE